MFTKALNAESVKRISEGVNRIHKGGVRGVIVDIEMPNGRGVAAFEKLLAAAPHIPILILSGVENENVAKQAVDRGAQDYLLKRNLDHFRLRRAVHLMIQRYANEEKSFFQQRCAEMTLACSGDAVIISDSAHRVTHLNAPAELLTGWSQAEARGHALNEILGETACVDPLAAASGAHEDAPCADTAILRRRDGVELNIKNCSGYIRDRDGTVTGTVAVLHDLGAVRAQIVELSLAAQHDFLTGLPNRSLVDDRITQAISFSARYNKKLAVMFVDLDLFKRINDSLGHAVGDKLLQQVAIRIVACVRRSDPVARIGGDEFVLVLSQVGHAEDAVFIARKILTSSAAPYLIDQKQLQINASIGVSTYPDDGTDSETLVHRADTAMYEAKKLGRNNCQFFRPEMQARVLEWQSLDGLDAGRGVRGANPTGPKSHRRATRRRRFWSGLFQLQLSAKIPIGCFESRPQLYKRHFFQPSQCHHLERAHRHRKEPESARGRRRRGDRGTIALSPKTRLQRRPGLLLLPSHNC